MRCPRCSGKGYVSWKDIHRLGMWDHWGAGACYYCLETGEVDERLPYIRRVDNQKDTWPQTLSPAFQNYLDCHVLPPSEQGDRLPVRFYRQNEMLVLLRLAEGSVSPSS